MIVNATAHGATVEVHEPASAARLNSGFTGNNIMSGYQTGQQHTNSALNEQPPMGKTVWPLQGEAANFCKHSLLYHFNLLVACMYILQT